MNTNNEFLIEKLKESGYSDENIKLLINGLTEDKLTTFRINKLKTNKENVKNILNNLEIEFSENQNFDDAIILNNYYQKDGFDSRTSLKLTNFMIYKKGHIYLQSLSLMIEIVNIYGLFYDL